ncbi:MAG: serine/threonine-protein kinase, partial [Novosphingobium sp.]
EALPPLGAPPPAQVPNAAAPPPSAPIDDDKTRFDLQPPPPAPAPPPPLPPASPPGAGVEDERTRFDAPPPPSPSATAVPPPLVVDASGQPRRIQIGDVLNHTYEVRRFIARGGMGEVFEGLNVNAEDDKVAIKVMLPHLSADPLVQAMFSKEAKTLTRLRHPGLVQYRLLGREPTLGVTYIVTEFVDGVNLSDVLKTLETTPQDQLTLLRRLAAALGAAHELDAIHRDISPDNVLLEGGRLKDAKIIDFGIAKDLDPGAKTIVGEGFAGKLGYVAPEQLGSYNRSVGPWTDVYSLGLVMLAVAQKKDVDMGGSLADAFDKRRQVPDLAAAPAELRPILERMLQPDPADRPRSMDEVLAAIADNAPGRPTQFPGAPSYSGGGGGSPTAASAVPASSGGVGKGVLIGGGALALAAAAGAYFLFAGGSSSGGPETEREARAAIVAGLPQVDCSWLDVASLTSNDGAIDVAVRGVAGKPSEAERRIRKLLADAKFTAGTVDFDDVSRVDAQADCGPLQAFKQIRDYDGERLVVGQRKYELAALPAGFEDAGTLAAIPKITVDLRKYEGDVGLFGLEESGEISQIIATREQLKGEGIEQPRPDVFEIPLQTDHQGWSGVLLLKGRGPFDAELVEKPAGGGNQQWVNRFLAAAKERGWKSEMVWYRTVDDTPG